MNMSQKMIDIQTRDGYFHEKFMEYYNTLPDDSKVIFKKTLIPCRPYMSNLEEVQDFIFWLNGADPMYTVSMIRNNEYGYSLSVAMTWVAWDAVFKELKKT